MSTDTLDSTAPIPATDEDTAMSVQDSTSTPAPVADTASPISPTSPTTSSAQIHPPPTGPAAMATGNRKRPRIDMSVGVSGEAGSGGGGGEEGQPKSAGGDGGRERKRGKSMFGVLLGTLNKARVEDKERSKSDAAKKRQLTEQRLQDRLRKETDSVRRAEEAKKDKTVANRKEEELQLKDSIYKYRRTRLPLYAHFLSTSDVVPPAPSSPTTDDDAPMPASPTSLAAPTTRKNPIGVPPAKSHPPPLFYMPVVLTPAQEAFLKKRKAEVQETAEKEWHAFREERTAGVTEITKLRERVAEEEARKKTEQQRDQRDREPQKQDKTAAANGVDDVKMGDEETAEKNDKKEDKDKVEEGGGMEIDDDAAAATAKTTQDTKVVETKVPVKRETAQTDEDDAVEY